MSFKKFALLVLTVFLISGFCSKPVSASANDDVTDLQTAQAFDKTEDNTDQTAMPVQSPVATPVVTVAPSATPKVTVTPVKNTTTKKTKKASSKKKTSYTKAELRLMASIINCEAGSESYQGKVAVGIVVMNRIKSKSFPNSLKKVIYQKYQFSPVRNGSLRKRLRQYDAGKTKSKQWKSCILAAKKSLTGQKTIVLKGKVKSLKGYHFFSVKLAGARIRLGGHRFK